jgi:hypothetical protein
LPLVVVLGVSVGMGKTVNVLGLLADLLLAVQLGGLVIS